MNWTKGVSTTVFVLTVWAVSAQSLTQYVDPWIGSEGEGRTFVGPSYPYGMVKPGPDCGPKYNSGWSPMPEQITGFSQVHVSGTGGGPKYGNILVQPFTGLLNRMDCSALRAWEKTELGYYATAFEGSNIGVEITTAQRVSFYRITYPEKQNMALKIDPGFFLGEQPEPNGREAQQFVGSEIEVLSETEVRGYSRVRGGWNNGRAYTVYFYAVFDQPITELVTWKGEQLFPNHTTQFDEGKKTGALLNFGSGTGQLQVKIGISFLSALKAKANVDAEVPHWDFKRVLADLEKAWELLLGKIEVAPQTSLSQKKMFYTALYHTMIMPVDRTGENPLWISEAPYYDDFYCIWDTYRTSSPLITLIDPDRQVEIINAMLNIYKHDGYLPEGRSGNDNGRTQGGSNAEVVIADAYVKGLTGIDYEFALRAMLKDATVPPGGNEEKEGRGGLNEYIRLGYIPYGIDRAGNRTVDYAYNDYCIALVSEGLGKSDLYEEYIRRSANWQNLWRPEYENHGARGFIMPRDEEGNWLEEVVFGKSKIQKPTFTYTPLTNESPWYNCWWCVFLYEGTSWEYSFSIPHDIPEVIRKSGGNDAFQHRLDTFFAKGFYDVANEPSFLTPTLYHWIGRPDLSSQRIHKIVAENFGDGREGLPGNDDSGAMSSWLVFQMIGLYPNAGQPYYLINTPLLAETTFHLGESKTFRIISRHFSPGNSYIRSARLNGKPLDRAWITHDEIMQGGELILELGAKPANWGQRILPSLK